MGITHTDRDKMVTILQTTSFFMNKNCLISIPILTKFIPEGPINTLSKSGDKTLSEAMMAYCFTNTHTHMPLRRVKRTFFTRIPYITQQRHRDRHCPPTQKYCNYHPMSNRVNPGVMAVWVMEIFITWKSYATVYQNMYLWW